MPVSTLIYQLIAPIDSWRLEKAQAGMSKIHTQFSELERQREKRIERSHRTGMSRHDGEEPLTFEEIERRKAKLSAEFRQLDDTHTRLAKRQRAIQSNATSIKMSVQ